MSVVSGLVLEAVIAKLVIYYDCLYRLFSRLTEQKGVLTG